MTSFFGPRLRSLLSASLSSFSLNERGLLFTGIIPTCWHLLSCTINHFGNRQPLLSFKKIQVLLPSPSGSLFPSRWHWCSLKADYPFVGVFGCIRKWPFTALQGGFLISCFLQGETITSLSHEYPTFQVSSVYVCLNSSRVRINLSYS